MHPPHPPPEYKSEWSKLQVYIEGTGSLQYMSEFWQKWRGLTEQYIGMSMARKKGRRTIEDDDDELGYCVPSLSVRSSVAPLG